MFQHNTYNEWLPIILGTEYMAALDILPVTYRYNTKYDPRQIQPLSKPSQQQPLDSATPLYTLIN